MWSRNPVLGWPGPPTSTLITPRPVSPFLTQEPCKAKAQYNSVHESYSSISGNIQMGQLKGRADSGVREGLNSKELWKSMHGFFFLMACAHHWCKHETSVRRDMMPCACSKVSLHVTAGAWLWQCEPLLFYTSGKANLHWLANQLLQEGNPVDNYLPKRYKELGVKPHHVLPRWTDIGRKENW